MYLSELVLSRYMHRCGIVGSYGNSTFSFLRNLHTAPTYIPTNSVEGFPFLHILSSICDQLLHSTQLFATPIDCSPPELLCLRNFPGKNTEGGCHFLLQGIFPTQGSNSRLLGLLYWQMGSLPLNHLGSPQVHCASVQM